MFSCTPTQWVALRDWLVVVLNLDADGNAIDPAPFSAANVRPARTDYPRAGNLYAMVREVSHVGMGAAPERWRREVGPNELNRYARTINEWTVHVQVVSKLDDEAPALADSAQRILQRVTMRVEGIESKPLRALGVAWMRSGQILPLDRIARSSQWETRAGVDLTFAQGERILENAEIAESVEVTGTLATLPEFTFTVDDDDDPDAI